MTVLNDSKNRRLARLRRARRVRRKVTGTTERPRLHVFRSTKHIYAQVIDDVKQVVVCSASTVSKDYKEKASKGSCPAAQAVGKALGDAAKSKGVTTVVFDKGGYRYHGRVKALADAAREAGLQF